MKVGKPQLETLLIMVVVPISKIQAFVGAHGA